MDPEYARRYRDLWERHWWWRARRRIVLEVVRDLVPPGGASILDIGCGAGLFFDDLSEFGDVDGVEPDPTLAASTRWRDKILVSPFDESVELRKRYSLILMLDVLEHMRDPQAALRHAARNLTDSGVVLITVPALPLLWTNHDDINRHHRRYTTEALRRLAADSGVELTDVRFVFHWTVPAKLAVRACESITRAAARPATIPPGWLNRFLLGLTLAEQRLLTPLKPPFGSSLLAVGRPATPGGGEGRSEL